MMLKDLQTNQESTKYIKSSWAKDYVILTIGLILILLSNYSSLNNNSETKKVLKTNDKISIDAPVVTENFVKFVKKNI